MSEPSITRWFYQLQNGDGRAAEMLWKYYFPRLVSLARNRFDADRDPVYGSDDAAHSALRLLYAGAKDGRYENVSQRDDLWRLLVVATRRKVIDRVRANETQKRGGLVERIPLDDAMQSPDPTPEMLAIMEESYSELLAKLRDDRLRQIALLRLEGFSNAEIAQQLDVSPRTIERKLTLIREDWSH